MSMLSPVLSFPMFWMSAFNIHFDNSLLQEHPLLQIMKDRHKYAWFTPHSLAVAGAGQGIPTVTLQWKDLAIDDVALR